jgi:hypothetical protein
MEYARLKEYRESERSFMRGFAWIVLVTVIFCVISRAPSMLIEGSLEGMKLQLNVGYVVTLGPLVIWILMLWQRWIASQLAEHRSYLPDECRAVVDQRRVGFKLMGLFLFPAIGMLFLLWQFVTEAVPLGFECEGFDHRRMLWDFSLYQKQMQYCFGIVDPKKAEQLPYVYPPLQTWGYVFLIAWTAYAAVNIWRDVRK